MKKIKKKKPQRVVADVAIYINVGYCFRYRTKEQRNNLSLIYISECPGFLYILKYTLRLAPKETLLIFGII